MDFKYTSEVFKKQNKQTLIKKKGVYPYDYMDSFDRFAEKQLPTKDDFYSILNDEHLLDEDYKHAKTIWDESNLKTISEYHIYISNLASYCWLTSLKISERLVVCNTTNWIHVTISPVLGYLGMLC